jgi:tellurite resistance protein TerC
MGIGESLKLSAFYIGIALLFGAWVWVQKGADLGMKYYTGFFIEKALSIDNVFVISLDLHLFRDTAMYQYRALLWGIIAVIVLRGIMIAVGAAGGGAILLGALHLRGLPDRDRHQDAVRGRQADGRGEQPRGEVHLAAHAGDAGASRQKVLRPQGRTEDRQAGRRRRRRSSSALVVINLADLVFAVDSVPAIFADHDRHLHRLHVEHHGDPGPQGALLRAGGDGAPFHYLKYALALVLVFIGSKIFVVGLPDGGSEIPRPWQASSSPCFDCRRHLYSLWKTGGREEAEWPAPSSSSP